MKNNDEILNELFFKKKKQSYTDAFKNQQAQYSPVTNISDTKNLFTDFDGKLNVSDMDEVKKRLVGALGMALGSNTVKSMAGKAIKNFPIIVSDDISSETLVMIKNMMEEQYASYIDLLISNQIINIADYKPGSDEGNIAIQALNKLDGTEFGMGRIAKQAQTGNLTVDDIMKNQPWWQLIRTNENYKSGNPLIDLLMEDAVIVPSNYENQVVSLLTESTSQFYDFDSDLAGTTSLNAVWKQLMQAANKTNTNPILGDTLVSSKDNHVWVFDGHDWIDRTEELVDKARKSKSNYIANIYKDDLGATAIDRYRKYGKYYVNTQNGLETRYNKLITPYIFTNSNSVDEALEDSIASMMTPTKFDSSQMRETKLLLKDKYTKATFLLASKRISGSEYISYLVDRLGIPVSDRIKQHLLLNYKIADVTFKGLTTYKTSKNKRVSDQIEKNVYTDELKKNIAQNENSIFKKIVPETVKLSKKDILEITGISLGAGATGAAVGGSIAAAAGVVGSALVWPILIPSLIGVLGAGTVAAISKWLKKKRANRLSNAKIEGWERVEQLIDEMDNYQKEIVDKDDSLRDFYQTNAELYDKFESKMTGVLSSVIKSYKYESLDIKPYLFNLTENRIENLMDDVVELEEFLQSNPDIVKEVETINEAKRFTISTTNPSAITIKNVMTGTKTKVKPKDIAGIIPEFGTKDLQAYGSVEYDKKALKDRKFNDPLILTIRFKERYSDDKYNDNELTAVIGIKGVVTRVPSNEMEAILKSNIEGKTLNNFFKGDENNNSKNLISNVLSSFMGTKYADKLPTSGKLWSNLEKVGQLAVANKLSGNNNGNISNAHLVFSQKEIDRVRTETGVDYIHNTKISAQLMRKYSAFMLAVCDDALQKVYTFSDPDAISWDDAPYSAYIGKSNTDQLISAFTQAQRMRL